ncbi:MAG: hypothetical protein WBE39_05960, partial [Candidatus Competibacter sp.]
VPGADRDPRRVSAGGGALPLERFRSVMPEAPGNRFIGSRSFGGYARAGLRGVVSTSAPKRALDRRFFKRLLDHD